MPLYEYECEQCRATFEVIQKFSDHSVETCRSCGGKVRRLASAPAIQFKGTGWYITDYARKGAGGAEKDKAGATSAEGGATSSPPAAGTDTKSASGAAATTSPTTSSGDNK
jgi:putative FmdB family regulatory protein